MPAVSGKLLACQIRANILELAIYNSLQCTIHAQNNSLVANHSRSGRWESTHRLGGVGQLPLKHLQSPNRNLLMSVEVCICMYTYIVYYFISPRPP